MLRRMNSNKLPHSGDWYRICDCQRLLNSCPISSEIAGLKPVRAKQVRVGLTCGSPLIRGVGCQAGLKRIVGSDSRKGASLASPERAPRLNGVVASQV